MNILEHIQQEFDRYTKNEQKIAQFIIKDPKHFIRQAIENTVEEIGVSKAALIRFCKKIGYSGYSEFIFDLTNFLINHDNKEDQADSIVSTANIYSNAIQELGNVINPQMFLKFTKEIISSQHVYSIGFNRTATSAKQFSLRCWSSGINVESLIDDSTFIVDHIKNLTHNDMLIILTTDDNTRFFRKNLTVIKNSNCKIAVITGNKSLPIVQEADYKFIMPQGLRKYGTFNDEQVLYFVFIEMLIHELSSLRK